MFKQQPYKFNHGSVDKRVENWPASPQVRARPLPITFYQDISPHTVLVRSLVLSNN